VKKGGITATKILSKAAKHTILKEIELGRYRDRAHANEPAFMSPSADPGQYSLVCNAGSVFLSHTYTEQWCSFCYDFGEMLLLCAGCRVSLCTARGSTMKHCVVWDPMIHQDSFIFFCPYCVKSQRLPCSVGAHYSAGFSWSMLLLQVKLTEPDQVPDKWSVLFRYDPAVLIVSVRWHKTKHGFGKLVRDRLYIPYTNNEQSVRALIYFHRRVC